MTSISPLRRPAQRPSRRPSRHLSRPARRRFGPRAALVAVVLAAAAAVPSSVSATPETGTAPAGGPGQAPPRSGSPGPAYERVAHFYGAYVDMADEAGSARAAAELRNFYLTADLRDRLAVWERRHDADGVLRAAHVPTAWRVTAGDSGMGRTTSTVRLTWGTGEERTYTYLTVRSDLATRKITDIESAY
ncbi:hypothetical protein [Streptomyces longispororuber]|uniref:hypothetical protein n=1 Tax=Streptomyces longispororuber TaxID=68230 RepID=UPI0036F65BE3